MDILRRLWPTSRQLPDAGDGHLALAGISSAITNGKSLPNPRREFSRTLATYMRLSLDAVGEKRVRWLLPAGPLNQESSDTRAVKSGPLSETLGSRS